MKKRDPETNCAYIKVEFKKDKSPLKDGSGEITGCFLTDPILQEMMEVNYGSERLKFSKRRMRGGKRGGRRGGRRGKKRGDPRMGFDTF